MTKKKHSVRSKPAKHVEKEQAQNNGAGEEWAFVQERYNSLSVDFNALAREIGGSGF